MSKTKLAVFHFYALWTMWVAASVALGAHSHLISLFRMVYILLVKHLVSGVGLLNRVFNVASAIALISET